MPVTIVYWIVTHRPARPIRVSSRVTSRPDEIGSTATTPASVAIVESAITAVNAVRIVRRRESGSRWSQQNRNIAVVSPNWHTIAASELAAITVSTWPKPAWLTYWGFV